MSRWNWKKIFRTIRTVLIGLFVVFVLFIALFYVPDDGAEVIGNTRYTADQIRQMVLTDFKNRNSVYLSAVVKNVEPANVPFIRNIEIRYVGHNRVELHVTENMPVGYIEQDGFDFYFDDTGMILQALQAPGSSTAPALAGGAADPAGGTQEALTAEAVTDTAEPAAEEESTTAEDAAMEGAYPWEEEEAAAAESTEALQSSSDGAADGTEAAAGAGEAGIGEAGAGEAGIGEAGVGEAGIGEAGVGEAGVGEAADGEADITSVSEADNASSSVSQEEAAEVVSVTVNTVSGETSQGVILPDAALFQADLTEILRVEGLVEKGTALHQGMKIVPKDKKIFSSIQALSKIVSKLEMKPDYVEITDGSHMSLHFGTIIIALGKDTNLETKMSRAAAIMEQLTGMSGTLHLETYTDSTVNIVFETDAVTEPEKRDSEDDSAWEDLQEYEENEGLDISWAEAWNQHNNEEGDKKKPEDGSEESTEGEIQTDAHGYYGTNGYQSQDYG